MCPGYDRFAVYSNECALEIGKEIILVTDFVFRD